MRGFVLCWTISCVLFCGEQSCELRVTSSADNMNRPRPQHSQLSHLPKRHFTAQTRPSRVDQALRDSDLAAKSHASGLRHLGLQRIIAMRRYSSTAAQHDIMSMLGGESPSTDKAGISCSPQARCGGNYDAKKKRQKHMLLQEW